MSDKIDTVSFEKLNLHPLLLKALKAMNHHTPSEIQKQTIPAVLEGRDILAASQTGTGKTAAFTLPILHLLEAEKGSRAADKPGGPRPRSNHMTVLVLAPTRELAAQIHQSVTDYSRYLDTRATVAAGGTKINPQMIRMTRGVHILVATPGRLLDLYRKNAVKFEDLKILVLDEADRMLNLGFAEELKQILNLIPSKRQTLMFTATFSEPVRSLARGLVRNPVEISVAPEVVTVEAIKQWVYPVEKLRKTELFLHLLNKHSGGNSDGNSVGKDRDGNPEKQEDHKWKQVLVFAKTKNRADHLAQKLEKKGIGAAAIHGDKSQGRRNRNLEEFKSGKIQVLVATDLAARGLDIQKLPLVVNFDLPHLKEDYIHRIGRTGRAEEAGEAISFVSDEEFQKLADIERLTKQVIDRIIVPGFEMEKPLPPSKLDLRPFKPKKPKKPKKKKNNRTAGI